MRVITAAGLNGWWREIEWPMSSRLIERELSSEILGNTRRIWFQPPPAGACAESLCVLLDGEYYVDRMDAPMTIDELQASGSVSPFATAFVSHIDGKTRWPESFCNSRFAQFL